MSTTWESNSPGDKVTMEILASEKPIDICFDYLTDSLKGIDPELSAPEVTIELLED
jgi:hypothetical protein